MSVSGTVVTIEDTWGDKLEIHDGFGTRQGKGARIYLTATETRNHVERTAELSFNLSQAIEVRDALVDFILENTP